MKMDLNKIKIIIFNIKNFLHYFFIYANFIYHTILTHTYKKKLNADLPKILTLQFKIQNIFLFCCIPSTNLKNEIYSS